MGIILNNNQVWFVTQIVDILYTNRLSGIEILTLLKIPNNPKNFKVFLTLFIQGDLKLNSEKMETFNL